MAYQQTLTTPAYGEYHEKGSRFLAYAYPCGNEAEFSAYLDALRHEHPKARHHCYAWRFGENGQHYRANDDGEPSGTAGLPIYNQLQSFNISDCGVIVVRYFGGTLLGASGLIRAYKNATQTALKEAKTTTIIPKIRLIAQTEYSRVNALMQIVKQHHLVIIGQDMALQCRFVLEGERDHIDTVRAQLHHAQIATEILP